MNHVTMAIEIKLMERGYLSPQTIVFSLYERIQVKTFISPHPAPGNHI